MDKGRILHQPLLRWAEKMCTDVLFSQWAEAVGRRRKYLTHFPAGNGQKEERGIQSRSRNANIRVELPREGSGMWGCPTKLFLPISGFHLVQFYLTSQTCTHSLTYFCTLTCFCVLILGKRIFRKFEPSDAVFNSTNIFAHTTGQSLHERSGQSTVNKIGPAFAPGTASLVADVKEVSHY